VIAVDPSSRRSGGALLGDRVRIDTDPEDQGVFVRSMAARDRLGGLAAMTTAAVVLMRAVHDLVIVETVGVGQSETEISEVGDTVLLCVQPGSGDSLQYMKAGIAEIPDIAVVNKADLGAPAKRTRADLTAALTTTGATAAQGWQVPVLAISARDDEGMAALLERIQAHWSYLRAGPLYARRQAQAAGWLEAAIREAYGRVGLERLRRLPRGMTFDGRESPFRALSRLGETLG
jgi:LAO/AO transport system kinase